MYCSVAWNVILIIQNLENKDPAASITLPDGMLISDIVSRSLLVQWSDRALRTNLWLLILSPPTLIVISLCQRKKMCQCHKNSPLNNTKNSEQVILISTKYFEHSTVLEILNDTYISLSRNLNGCSTLSQEYCKLIGSYWKIMRRQL